MSTGAELVRQADWQPTHRHRKGGLYRVITTGMIEATMTLCTIYESRDGHVWVRPTADFNEPGRFTPLKDAEPVTPYAVLEVDLKGNFTVTRPGRLTHEEIQRVYEAARAVMLGVKPSAVVDLPPAAVLEPLPDGSGFKVVSAGRLTNGAIMDALEAAHALGREEGIEIAVTAP